MGVCPSTSKKEYRGVAQLVARLLWEQDAAGSNPVTPTIEKAADFCRWSFAMPVFMRVCRALEMEKCYNYTRKQNRVTGSSFDGIIMIRKKEGLVC